MAIYKPNLGTSTLFWMDNWIEPSLRNIFPHLFSFAKKQKCSLRYYLDNETSRNFDLPILVQASEELEVLQLLLQNRAWT